MRRLASPLVVVVMTLFAAASARATGIVGEVRCGAGAALAGNDSTRHLGADYLGCLPDTQAAAGTGLAYTDPRGTVSTQRGTGIAGATVTLYRSDSADGPFAAVTDGSANMSPSNRHNPDMADPIGHFGWAVIAGFYRVRAESPGCHKPGDPGTTLAETSVLTVPPPVTNLNLQLSCSDEDEAAFAAIDNPPPPTEPGSEIDPTLPVSDAQPEPAAPANAESGHPTGTRPTTEPKHVSRKHKARHKHKHKHKRRHRSKGTKATARQRS